MQEAKSLFKIWWSRVKVSTMTVSITINDGFGKSDNYRFCSVIYGKLDSSAKRNQSGRCVDQSWRKYPEIACEEKTTELGR